VAGSFAPTGGPTNIIATDNNQKVWVVNGDTGDEINQYTSDGTPVPGATISLGAISHYGQTLAVTSTNKLYTVIITNSVCTTEALVVREYNALTSAFEGSFTPSMTCGVNIAIGNNDQLYISNSSYGQSGTELLSVRVSVYDTASNTESYSLSLSLASLDPSNVCNSVGLGNYFPSSVVRGIGVDAQGNIYLTVGQRRSATLQYECEGMIKYSSAGSVIWTRRFSGSNSATYTLNAISPGAGVIIDPTQSKVNFGGTYFRTLSPALQGMVLNQDGGILTTIRSPGYDSTGNEPDSYIPFLAAPGSTPSQKNLTVLYASYFGASDRSVLILRAGTGTCHPTLNPTRSPTKNPV
jgi:hypothetical protein